jgi:hypothetical protein
LTQMLLPLAPVLVISTTESPMFRLAAYRTWNGESAVIGFWAKAAAVNNRAVAEKATDKSVQRLGTLSCLRQRLLFSSTSA